MSSFETRRIFKFPLAMKDWNRIEMPKDAEILCVQVQNGAPQIWALCEPDNFKQTRAILIVGTGNEIPDGMGRYIGTFQMVDGAFVWHCFEAAK